jgi:hemoglobin
MTINRSEQVTHERSPEITVDALRALVHGFYGRVRDDVELGPVFERVVGQSPGGWEPHLAKMTDFWSAVMLQIPGYRGNPREAHGHVADIRPQHFARWLFLFQLEAHRVFEAEPAQRIVAVAQMMGQNLKRAQFGEVA